MLRIARGHVIDLLSALRRERAEKERACELLKEVFGVAIGSEDASEFNMWVIDEARKYRALAKETGKP